MARSKWQIHLSTAMALMIAANVMVLLNIQQRHPPRVMEIRRAGPPADEMTKVGWPWDVATRYRPGTPGLISYSKDGTIKYVSGNPGTPGPWRINYYSTAADAFVWLAALLTIWIVLEYFIASREPLMEESKRRNFWKIHLVTFILLIDVVGALILLNGNTFLEREYLTALDPDEAYLAAAGWPCVYWSDTGPPLFLKVRRKEFSFSSLALDVWFGIFIIGCVGLHSEFLIRRREKNNAMKI